MVTTINRKIPNASKGFKDGFIAPILPGKSFCAFRMHPQPECIHFVANQHYINIMRI